MVKNQLWEHSLPACLTLSGYFSFFIEYGHLYLAINGGVYTYSPIKNGMSIKRCLTFFNICLPRMS